MDQQMPIALSESCLAMLHQRALTCKEEWGTTFVPVRVKSDSASDGALCTMTCSESGLIQGTVGEPSEESSAFFGKPMKVAVTPFHHEVITPMPTCYDNITVTMFAHTHPRKLVGNQLAVPSAGDMVSHLVLGNATNWYRNRQINTGLVVGVEGLYHYYILPATLQKYIEEIERLSAEEEGGLKALQDNCEATPIVMSKLRKQVMKELQKGYVDLQQQMTDDKKMLKDGFKRNQFDKINALAVKNKLLDHLYTLGMGYDFYPVETFKSKLVLRAAVTGLL